MAILGLPEEAAGVLEGWGVRSLADLSRLPRAALGARLGRAGLELRDRVSGRRARPLKLSAPGSCYRRGQEFEHRIETLEALLFILKRFVDELVLELEAGGAAAFELRLELELDDGGILRRRIELPEPSQRGGTLSRVLQSALEDMRTESAIRAVALRLQTAPARSCQGELFAVVMEDAARFGETADRVAAIVGPGRSGSPRVGDSWRPDDFSMENVDTDVDPGKDGADVPDGSGLPFRRLRPPCSLRVMKEGGRPVAVAFTPSARHPALARLPRGAVTCARGPWRSSGGWWESGAWVREEWDVEMAGGGLYRIFRSKEGWFLEGVYG